MKPILGILSVFVNDHNPLGLVFVLCVAFLFLGTFKDIEEKIVRKADRNNKYSKYQGILSDNSSTPNVIMHEVCVFFNLCKSINLNLFRMNK